jgi:hypothetical protein
VPLGIASKVAHLPPVSTLFAALLGYNPIHNLLGPTGVLNQLSAKQVGVLTGKQFFPSVISGPFHHGLVIVFTAAAIMSFIGAMVSLLRGKQFYYDEGSGSGAGQVAAATAAPTAPAVRGTEPNGTPREAANGPAVTAGTSGTANGLAVTAGTSGTANGTSGNGHGTNGRANGTGANRARGNGTGANRARGNGTGANGTGANERQRRPGPGQRRLRAQHRRRRGHRVLPWPAPMT